MGGASTSSGADKHLLTKVGDPKACFQGPLGKATRWQENE